MENDFHNACLQAEQNGHKLGHIFKDAICFCTKCHAPLTYRAIVFISSPNYKNTYTCIDGLYGSKCNG